MKNLHSSERAAIAIFGVLFASTFIENWLYRELWILSALLLAFVWLTALLLAVVHWGDALRDDELHGRRRVRAIAAIPLALALVLGSKFGLWLGYRAEASVYLFLHSDEMRRAQAKAGAGRAAAIIFASGVPDGGLAIIRSPVPPWTLPQSEQVHLTGERLRQCRTIVPDAWVCGYD